MAWTERYVRDDAAGGGNGTTDANSGANGAWTLAEGVANEAAGMRVNVKAGTYANGTTTRALAAVGTTTAPIWWRGFKVTPGDQDLNNLAVPGTDIPSLTFTTGQFTTTGAHHTVSNFSITGANTGLNAVWQVLGATVKIYRCRVINTSTGLAINLAGTGETAVGCYLEATTAAVVAANLNSLDGSYIGCVVKGGVIGIQALNQRCSMFGNVLYGQAGDAISVSIPININACSIYSPGGNGIAFTTGSWNCIVANCYFENVNQVGKAAIANTSGTNINVITCVANAFYNCTANILGMTESFAIFDNGSLASAAFTDPGSQDFSIGAIAKGIGFPGLFENTNVFRGYLDVGAVQRQEPASTGGLMINPGLVGGLR